MPGASTDFVQAKVAGNREKPGGELAGRLVAFAGFPDLNEDILGDVLRLVDVVDQPVNQVHHRLLELLHQRLVGRQVSLLHPQHQGHIGIVPVNHAPKI